MEQRLSFITIGARNMTQLKQFYTEKFGWTTLKDDGGIVFFKMNGFILGLYPAEELAADAKVPLGGPGFKGFTLAINYDNEKKVDEVFMALSKAGVTILKAQQKTSWGGYSGYVADPEGNCWEIAYNPYLVLSADGNVLGQH
jgi:catechol 2,3-dioxygenase-like lactoylglutathione lyase family enzyme